MSSFSIPDFRWNLAFTFLLVLALLMIGLTPSRAEAQTREPDVPELQLQRFRPAPGPGDFLNVYGTPVADHLEWDIGAYFDIADRPLAISTGGTIASGQNEETVDSQTTLSLVGNIGLYDRFEVGFLLPVTLIQSSEELEPVLLNDPRFSTTDLGRAAINDSRISAKYRILDVLEDPLGLALVVNGYIPLASNNAFSSDNSASFEGRVAADAFVIDAIGLRLGLNLGYRWRGKDARVFRDALIKDELIWGLAANLPLAFDRLDLIAEINGGIGIADRDRALREEEVNAELYVAGRFKLNENWSLTGGFSKGFTTGVGTPNLRALIGVGGYWVTGTEWGYDYDGDGIYGERDECPQGAEDYDGFEDFDGCPDLDNDDDGIRDDEDKCDNSPEGVRVGDDGCPDDDLDGDGIPNQYDKCPEDPEDRDSYKDGDGCPDVDNDGDGLYDTEDDCPNDPENKNGFLDEDGCPDDPDQQVVVSNNKLIITEPVYFATGKSEILSQSFPILDEVARVLDENPQIALVRIEGHTDSRGRDSYNLRLSQERAASVRRYLMKQGISRDRLEAVGYGETQPIADNETEEGRAKNRRVEFTIIEQ